jgi:WD40 repeat protein
MECAELNSMNMQLPRPNPYVGPRAFKTGETLYGRDGDILNLYYLLLAERVVLLFSPSGAGKSSLIHAGLIPRLQEKFGFLPIIRVNQEPPESLLYSRGFNRYVFSALLSMEETVAEDNRLPPEHLATLSLSGYLTRRAQPNHQDDETVKPVFEILIFDQFEEILTTAPNDYEAKKIFFDQLGEALHDNKRWALFSARQDYAAAFEPYLRAIPTRFSNRYRLDLLDADKALQAIQKPALEMGVDFTDSAAQKLVDDLRRVQTQRPDGTIDMELGRYVETVQLQVVCYRLWNNLSIDETTITEKHIASIGSVDESLSAYYSDQVNKGKEKFNVPERIIREWFNDQLITKQGIRSQVMLEPEKSGGLDNRVIRFMESAHLVRAEKRAGSTWFELSHDRLIEPIRTDNEKWLATHLSLLQQQANIWNQQDRPESLLLREKELAQARLWSGEHESELLQYEKDFLNACEEKENRARRLKRRNQIISVLGIVAMILAAIAFVAYRQADIQRQEAQRQERIARAGQLAAQSHTALDEFPQRSLLLALEALKVTSVVGEARQASAEEALRAALDQPRGLPLGNHTKPVTVVAFSNDGRWLASSSEDMTIEIWDLHALGPGDKTITLNSNGTEIWVMGFSPDGHWLAAGGDHQNALLWNLADLRAGPLTLSGHAANIKSLAFSPNDRWLATGSVDGTIRLWDLQTPDPAQNPRVLPGHQGDISSLAFDPSGTWLASGSLDTTARLWKVADSSAAPIVLEGHRRNISALAFSPDGRWLATASYDQTARLWDLQAADPAAHAIVLTGHTDSLTCLAFSPDSHWLATGSQDHTARLWNLQAADPAANSIILRGHGDAINALAFSPETPSGTGGRWLATGSSDHSVRLWDLKSPDPAATSEILRGHDDAVFTLAFSPDGLWLATGAGDNSTRLWDMRTPFPAETQEILRGPNDEVDQVAFSQNGRWLSAGSLDGSALLWDMNSANLGADPLILRQDDRPILALAFSPSGHWLATAGGDNPIWLWNLNSKNPPADPGELRGNVNPVLTLAFSPATSSGMGDHWLASGSQDGSVRLWDLQAKDPNAAPRLLGTDKDHPVVALAFSPDSHWLAAASGFTVWLWDINHPDAAPLALKKHADRVTSLAFSPDGQWLATGSMDKTAQVWRLDSTGLFANPLILQGHDDWVNVLAFSFDSRWLATGSKDHTTRLWDMHAANPAVNPLVLRGHDDNIRSLAFSPDGNWLATGSDDHTSRLWNLRATNPAADSVVLRGHTGTVNSVAFNPNTQTGTSPALHVLATGSSDHTLRLWQLQLDELEIQACQSAGRNLTSKEWAQYFPNRAYEVTCPIWPPAP